MSQDDSLGVFIGADISKQAWVALQERGLSLSFIHLADLLAGMRLQFDGDTVAVHFEGIDLTAGTQVWYHPGQYDLLTRSFVQADSELNFLRRQHDAALSFLELWLETACHCVDAPSVQRRAGNKLIQLYRLAQALPGLLPVSSVTALVQAQLLGRVVKHLSEARNVSSEHAFYARRLDGHAMRAMTEGPPCPMLFQQYIHADEEYRAYCFGDAVVTIQIPRTDNSDIVDIHFDPDLLNQARLIPRNLASAVVRSIHSALGLNFMAVDYMLSDGQPVILEVNPLFSWEWLPGDAQDEIAGNAQGYLRTLTQ